jgi:ferredoxin
MTPGSCGACQSAAASPYDLIGDAISVVIDIIGDDEIKKENPESEVAIASEQ